MLETFKKCNSRVDGDIPRELVKPCAGKLAEALTLLYNACLLYKQWPARWKTETVIPIPKTISPGTFDDIRPISMTTLWSKILESYVATFTLDETKDNWKNNQYGGRKGASTDHVLVELWDKILSGLDRGAKAVVLAGIDFSKSFSRCSHQEILKAYARLGLSDWGIGMHAAFLDGRKMRVKVGNMISDEHSVTGGAVQGSVLGVMDHNAVMEFIDDDIDYQNVYKYVDDLTTEEEVDQAISYLAEDHPDILEQVHTFKPPKTQKSIEALEQACQDRKLMVNERKTQLLSISSGRNPTKCWISLKDGSTLFSEDNFKLLGFMFNARPDVKSQINYIINRASSRFFVIRHLASFNADKTRLRNVYCSIVRSVMEYSSVTFGSMITKLDSNRLENLQKKCLRSIYGYGLEYEDLLVMANLESLEDRRSKALLKFARKAVENPQFSHWFPLNPNRTGRHGKTYEEKFAKSDRLYRSPLFTMRRLLNDTPDSDRNCNPEFFDLSHFFNA